MIEYELFYLVGESKDAELSRIRQEVADLVTSVGGFFLAPETEEKRKLAYLVKKEVRGTYIARRFTLPDRDENDALEEKVAETHPLVVINKSLHLSKDVLRFLLVSAKGMPELKAIPREERPRTESKGNRYEKRGAVRPLPQAPAPQQEVKKAVSEADMDAQLKAKLDI